MRVVIRLIVGGLLLIKTAILLIKLTTSLINSEAPLMKVKMGLMKPSYLFYSSISSPIVNKYKFNPASLKLAIAFASSMTIGGKVL